MNAMLQLTKREESQARLALEILEKRRAEVEATIICVQREIWRREHGDPEAESAMRFAEALAKKHTEEIVASLALPDDSPDKASVSVLRGDGT